ncbi:DUF222 domain-containing protein [Marmoricola sp. RAF53]|uniref:HNH endonuclease signature motif containing protein n=1 Tax=Marmoricola sp. RAF53 TaxID=3233059 RepID=UPI003F989FF4
MTSGTDLLDAPAASPAAELHACLDRVCGVEVDGLSGEAQAALLQSLVRAESRVAALRMRVLAAADRSKTALKAGAASTGQWAAKLANTDQIEAQRQVGLATGLNQRARTQEALLAGTISAEHAAVIVRADRDLPVSVTHEQREIVEAALVEKARSLSPGGLRRAARRALAAVEPDPVVVNAHENDLLAAEEDHARTRTRLTLHDNKDGTLTGHFTIPTAQGHLLRKVLQAITAPRRGRLGASAAQIGDREARTDWDRARGEAFCELLEHLPTDHLHPRTAATLIVTVEHDTLREALQVAHLDTGTDLSAGEARRLACNAGIIPAVLGGASLPLDLGRSSRLFTETQRTALGLRHHTCAADGCERPYAWCELHHQDPWSHGGKTDLDQAIPLCHWHHRRIHDPHYQHTRARDGSLTFHRRT